MAQIIRQPNETDEAWAARVKQLRETQKALVLPHPSIPEESKQQDRRWLPIINDGVQTNIHGTEVHIPETNPFAEANNPPAAEKDGAIRLPENGGSSENEQPKQYPVVKVESNSGGARSAAEMDAELIRMRATLSTMQNSSQGSEQTPTGKISGTVDGGGGAGYSGTVTVISSFRYTGSLQYKTRALTYVDGVLTSVAAESDWVTLFTTTAGCPS